MSVIYSLLTIKWTQTDDFLDHFNNLTPKLKFTLKKEAKRKINSLDITISTEPKKLSIDIYRKPIYTDIIIPNDSCHPKRHKLAATRYFYNRMITYQLSSENLKKEQNIIQQILHNNGYDTSTAKNLHGKIKQEKDNKKV